MPGVFGHKETEFVVHFFQQGQLKGVTADPQHVKLNLTGNMSVFWTGVFGHKESEIFIEIFKQGQLKGVRADLSM